MEQLLSKSLLETAGISHFDEDGNMHMLDGRIKPRDTCINFLTSGCTNATDWGTGGTSYCRRCAAEYDRECEQERKNEVFRQMLSFGIEIGALPKRFDYYQPKSLYAWQSQALNQMRSDYKRNVWLHAEHGQGKTEVGYQCVYDALHNGIKAAYIDCAGTGLTEICRNHNARQAIGAAKLLVLDDMSKLYITEYSAAELHNLLSERHQGALRTIVISEKSGKSFASILHAKTDGRFGASTIDRLSLKGSQCLSIEMRGENIRRK